jgi:PBP1b-binding outer membrane lipoprotein LpoB
MASASAKEITDANNASDLNVSSPNVQEINSEVSPVVNEDEKEDGVEEISKFITKSKNETN